MAISRIGCTLYVTSGVLQPVLIDWLRLHHALGRRWMLLPTLANAVAMAATGLLARRMEWQHMKSQLLPFYTHKLGRLLLLTAATDLCSGMLLAGGILWTGGSVYILLYNSVPVWTVVLSKILLTKTRPISLRQMMGVLLVTVGLVSTVLASPTTTTTTLTSTKLTQGSIMVLLGSLLQATMFILTESALHPSSTTSSSTILSARVWCSLVGSLESCFMTLWVTVGYVLWGFWEEDSITIVDKHASPWIILGGFCALCAVNAIHAAAFFGLLQQIGAAGSSLLRGLQTVVVVLVSALFFCSPHEPAQCLTPLKSFSLVIVLIGMYTYSSSPRSHDNKKHRPRIENKYCHSEANTMEYHCMA